ncbi:MAG: type IV toxin-antitoxin system AbiEi family antitoxin domain-containing protein [Spirochaetales bacterium]
MLKDTLGLMQDLAAYGNPKTKLSRLVKSGAVTQVRRGLYVEGSPPPPIALAPVIYGPSYLSFEFALAFHRLIPERVSVFTSAAYGKNKDKAFTTPYGEFTYAYLPRAAYPYGLERKEEGGYHFLIACPEKALADVVYKRSGIQSPGDVRDLLFDDLRIEPSSLHAFDWNQIRDWSPLYGGRSVKALANWGSMTYA